MYAYDDYTAQDGESWASICKFDNGMPVKILFGQVQFIVKKVSELLFMTPTSKKLERHIASRMFVRVCIRPCVHPLRFLMHSIISERCMLGF